MALFLIPTIPLKCFIAKNKNLHVRIKFTILQNLLCFSSTGKVFQHVQPNMYIFTFGVISFNCLLRFAFLRPFPIAVSFFRILRMKAPTLIKMKRALINTT